VEANRGALAPLTDAKWLETLELPGGAMASVAVPVGSTEPRPLVVAVHGAGDRPEWACGGWRLATGAYPFVVCPRGVPLDRNHQSFAWQSEHTIAPVVNAALAAVRARFGAYIAPGPMMYAGFSQGAILAGPLLLSHAREFPTVVLAEGGYELVESAHFARKFHEAGGERLVLVCGGQGCLKRMQRGRVVLEREGLMAQVVGDAKAGHNLNERMQQALRQAWPSFVQNDPRWAGLLASEAVAASDQ